MSFAIMRFAKLKTGGPITGSVSHIARSRPTPNADPARKHLNRSIVGPGHDDAAAIRSAITDRTPGKFRKDAVRVLEFVVTATPAWFEQNPSQVDAYFDSAVEWLRAEFGTQNIVSAIQHNDESTPHMHVLVVPVDPDSGKLNAKRWVGGRGKLRQLQTDFANHQSRFGVERGKPNPARKHTTVQSWYDGHASLDEREKALSEREKILLEQRAKLSEKVANINEHIEKFNAAKGRFKTEKQKWQQLRDEWVSKHKPVELSRVERLSLEFAEMPFDPRCTAMRELWSSDRATADAVDRLGWVTYEKGEVTPEGRRILIERGTLDQQENKIDDWRLSGLDNGPKGP